MGKGPFLGSPPAPPGAIFFASMDGTTTADFSLGDGDPSLSSGNISHSADWVQFEDDTADLRYLAASNWPVQQGATSFTVRVVFKPDVVNLGQNVIMNALDTGTNNDRFSFEIRHRENAGIPPPDFFPEVRVAAWNSAGVDNTFTFVTASWIAGSVYEIEVAVELGASATYNLFIDGIKHASPFSGSIVQGTTASVLLIGTNAALGDDFVGNMRNLRIFDSIQHTSDYTPEF